MSEGGESRFELLEQVRQRVQEHVDAVTRAAPDQIHCRAGCSGCCLGDRSLTLRDLRRRVSGGLAP